LFSRLLSAMRVDSPRSLQYTGFVITIDQSRCRRCNLCWEACPDGIIAKGPRVREETQGWCIRCGHCAAICPAGAILVEGMRPGAELPAWPPVSADGLLGLLKGRRSGRIYRPDPVRREHLQRIIEAASLAPSAMNARPVAAMIFTDAAAIAAVRDAALASYRRVLRMVRLPGFPLVWRILGQRQDRLGLLRHGLSTLVGGDKPDALFFGAPALAVLTVPEKEPMAAWDALLAAQNAILMAEALGLAACFNGYLVMAAGNRSVRAALRLPKGRKVAMAFSMGYPRAAFLREIPRDPIPTTWI